MVFLQVGCGLIWTAALVWTAVGFYHDRAWNLSDPPASQIESLHTKILSLATHPNLKMSGRWHHQGGDELIQPENVVPDPTRWPVETFSSLLKWSENCAGAPPQVESIPSLKKFRIWAEAKCADRKLSEEFFREKPWTHPLGGSWVAWAHRTDYRKYDRAWLSEHRELLHLLELGSFSLENLAPEEKVLSSLTPGKLGQLIGGASLVNGHEYTLLMRWAYHHDISYAVIDRSTFEEFLEISPYKLQLADQAPSCFHFESDHCWQLAESWPWRQRFQLSLWLTVAFLGTMVVGLWRRRREEKETFQKDREILVQTLAHELRHPATSLGLSLEVFREAYDRLPSLAQTEFLRMCDQLTRLKRLIRASDQYLQTSSAPGEPFQFSWISLESVNDYFNDILEPYRQKIEIKLLSDDVSLVADPYWLSLCVTNLVKNALIHGVKPIQLRLDCTGDDLTVLVCDQGKGVTMSLNEMTKANRKRADSPGLGLGLSLVDRIAHLMGGRLEFSSEPTTTFRLIIKRRYAQNLAS